MVLAAVVQSLMGGVGLALRMFAPTGVIPSVMTRFASEPDTFSFWLLNLLNLSLFIRTHTEMRTSTIPHRSGAAAPRSGYEGGSDRIRMVSTPLTNAIRISILFSSESQRPGCGQRRFPRLSPNLRSW